MNFTLFFCLKEYKGKNDYNDASPKTVHVRPFFCTTTPILDNNLLIWLGSLLVCKASCPILLKRANYSSLNDKIRETLATMNIKNLIMIIFPTATCC